MSDDEQMCDCGHPVTYHKMWNDGIEHCGWNPPHSHIRCKCTQVTITGTQRDERYDPNDPAWKPWGPL